MHTFKIYLERADDDEPRQLLGTVQADTMAQALQIASELYEIPSYDLVAVQEVEKQKSIDRLPEQEEQHIIELIARQQHPDSAVERIEPFLTGNDRDTMWLVTLTTPDVWRHHIVVVTNEQIKHYRDKLQD
jgi:dTDP-D-glucose 4,6-dehydratase